MHAIFSWKSNSDRILTKAQQLLRWVTVPEQSGPKVEVATEPLSEGGAGSPSIRQCRLGEGLPPYQVTS